MSEGPDTFLRRWSGRKQADRETQDTSTTVQSAGSDTAMSSESSDDDAKPLTDADMPALETLGEESDYSGFLSPEVSEALRKKALRKMFHLATYNITDGLDDYDEDFTVFEPLGDMITADMRHQTELQAERAREAALEDETALAASDSQEHTDRDTVDALAQDNTGHSGTRPDSGAAPEKEQDRQGLDTAEAGAPADSGPESAAALQGTVLEDEQGEAASDRLTTPQLD